MTTSEGVDRTLFAHITDMDVVLVGLWVASRTIFQSLWLASRMKHFQAILVGIQDGGTQAISTAWDFRSSVPQIEWPKWVPQSL